MFQFKRHHYCYKTRGDNQVLCDPQKLTFLKPEMNAENINKNSLSFLRKSLITKYLKLHHSVWLQCFITPKSKPNTFFPKIKEYRKHFRYPVCLLQFLLNKDFVFYFPPMLDTDRDSMLNQISIWLLEEEMHKPNWPECSKWWDTFITTF